MKNIELLLLIGISWIGVRFLSKNNEPVLGLRLTRYRLKYAVILLFITALCCTTGYLMRMYFVGEQFGLKPNISPYFILTELWLTFESVLFEELFCRGVGLFILIKRFGAKTAILISATVFGLLHLNNASSFGDLNQLALLFAFPFLFGLLFAYAYVKSFSIYLPFAMHFGWNLTQNFVFPDSTSGDSLLLSVAQPVVTVSYLILFLILLLPKLLALIIDFLIVRGYKKQEVHIKPGLHTTAAL